ncbi:hypothetical protein GQ457_10G001520 [Hibiscus cannabinus]
MIDHLLRPTANYCFNKLSSHQLQSYRAVVPFSKILIRYSFVCCRKHYNTHPSVIGTLLSVRLACVEHVTGVKIPENYPSDFANAS